MRGLHASRSVHVAADAHECFAACGVLIPKGEYYIKDTATRPTGNFHGQRAETIMTLAWHLECAPRTKADAKRCLDDAIKENAKHPTRLGVGS